MSAHVVELCWPPASLGTSLLCWVSPLAGARARTVVWLESEVTDGTVAGLRPPSEPELAFIRS